MPVLLPAGVAPVRVRPPMRTGRGNRSGFGRVRGPSLTGDVPPRTAPRSCVTKPAGAAFWWGR